MSDDKRCKHFNGIQHDTCRMDIDYKDVGTIPRYLPCFGKNLTKCAYYEQRTAEEIEAAKKTVAEFLVSLDAFCDRKNEDCPHCGDYVTRLEKVGRSVYVRPCNCRLYQGDVPPAWKAS